MRASKRDLPLNWQRLVEQYEPQQRTRFAGQVQSLLSWMFAGDIEGRIEAFERETLRYEHASGEGVSDALRIGIVLRQLEETKLKEHLLMSTSKLTAWKDFKAETIKRTQANIGPLPMDLDAFSKGKAKGAKNAWEKASERQRQRRQRHQVQRQEGCLLRKGKDAKGKAQCHKCWRHGHFAANCPSQSLNSFEAGTEQTPSDDTWWWWSATDEQQWWTTPAAEQASTSPTGAVANATATALKLNTLTLEGASPEPVQTDNKTGRCYYTASGEKLYDKGVQHVRGLVKGASSPIDVKLRVADVREGLLSAPEIVDKGFKVVFNNKARRNALRDVHECLAGPFWPAGQLLVRLEQAPTEGAREREAHESCFERWEQETLVVAYLLGHAGGETSPRKSLRENSEENGGIGANRSPRVCVLAPLGGELVESRESGERIESRESEVESREREKPLVVSRRSASKYADVQKRKVQRKYSNTTCCTSPAGLGAAFVWQQGD
eukprot:6490687-Amphidinium_carterae.1